ncbi:MAG: hypothetical protein PWP23_1389 [Candidatus Sumerlaeota bacterium]|nr:hypothetical protein [Candidatus Sumerlaeota bacterium]
MPELSTVKEQTLLLRRMIGNIAAEHAERADHIPPTWKNNLRWHVGHLVTTPRLLVFGLLGEPLGMSEDYRHWFAKGSSPAAWEDDVIPPLDQLIEEMTAGTEAVFEAVAGRENTRFAQPYTTSLGAVLSTPAEALMFSQAHDGIHLGLVLALRRALA